MNFESLYRQRGLSLIELMIALLLSAMLLWGVLQIFDSNRATIQMSTAFARVQESGRFAMDELAKQIRIADYWGCAPDSDSIENHLDTTDTDYSADILGDMGTDGILAQDNVASGFKVDNTDVIAGTDVLYLRGADDACGGTGRMMPSAQAASLQVSQNCDVTEGDIVLLTNCQGGELFQITSVQDGNGGDSGKRTITHNTGLDITVRNFSKPLQRQYGADSRILKPYQRVYFIANSGVTQTPSLYVSDNGSVQELVPGVEDMQILYGRDTDSNNSVDSWSTGSQDSDNMGEVLAIRVQLVVASDSAIGADDLSVTDLDSNSTDYTDGKLRKVYVTTSKVRNRGKM